ncbi:hypothetical protein M5103_004617 [Vibrio alginolyticus]|uniref:hypothetical protein n=1 Tax=Vibrio alginolyticus TaxID=663 RepID=UPI00215F13BB|nr:hypothetical protein [Vibrio alginolyticus]EJE8156859.1 hypothetical protein [Vibrio alginolyticus]ELB2939167.1 hypothetical protein [Vibrio alginolyticus]MCS0182630.1 hypothetical protein [Vibrio alginolyticus]
MSSVVEILSHEVYLKHLELKLSNIQDISKVSEEEALVLCCCYIEAIGSKKHQLSEPVEGERKRTQRYSKSAAFTDTLVKYSGYDFWDKVHPIALVDLLPPIFDSNYEDYLYRLAEIGDAIREAEFVVEHVEDLFVNTKQREWFKNHIHKGSLGSIAYSRVRSEIVHNVSHEPFSFLATWQGEAIPDIDYKLMEGCLTNVIRNLRKLSIEQNKLWWEL